MLPFRPSPGRWTAVSDWRSTCAFTALYNRFCYIDAVPTVASGHRRRFRTRLSATAGGTSSPGTFECPKCRKIYKWYRGLHRHLEYECGKTPRFKCPHCVYIGKHRSHVYSHIKSNHYNRPVYAIDLQDFKTEIAPNEWTNFFPTPPPRFLPRNGITADLPLVCSTRAILSFGARTKN